MAKRRKRNRAASSSTMDIGTTERGRQGMGIEMGARIMTDGGIVVHEGAKVVAASVLEEMLKARLLDGEQGSRADRKAIAHSRYEAGERLQRLFMLSGLNKLKAVDFNRSGGSGGEMDPRQAQAAQQFNEVNRALGVWMNCLTAVVLHDHRPSNIETVRNVRNALDRLCVVMKL